MFPSTAIESRASLSKRSLVAASFNIVYSPLNKAQGAFYAGLDQFSERDSNGLICTDPTALWQISRYSHGLCQQLGGNLVATDTA